MSAPTSTHVRRFGMAARLVTSKREEYLALHRNVWPEVERTITECGIRNFTIFTLGDFLVAYYEYVGEDFEADQRKMAADPTTQEWLSRTSPCQLPLIAGSSSPNWEQFTEVWHLA